MTHDTCVLTRLDQYGLLAVAGDDATTFLQNQLSNDVSLVTAEHSQLNSYSTPKGRMLTIFRLMLQEHRYLLRMPKALIPSISKRLQLYVLMSKVTLSDASTELNGLGVAGPAAADLLKNIAGIIPANVGDTICNTDYYLMKIPGKDRFEVYATPEKIAALHDELAKNCTIADQSLWPLLDIEAGIPTVYPETSEHFVPQMTNMQLIGGVSFKKGCYPGQEIVARMQYRGTLKRRMHLVEIAGSSPPSPGTTIVSVDADSGKAREAGEIVDAQANGDSSSLGLAVLQISSLELPLHIGDNNGPILKLQNLPYEFDA